MSTEPGAYAAVRGWSSHTAVKISPNKHATAARTLGS